jgi:hypothetical protein
VERETQDLLSRLVEQSKEATIAAQQAARAATRVADRVATLEGAIGATRHEVQSLADEVARVRRRVDGSNPPPDAGPPDPATGKMPRPPSLADVAGAAHRQAAGVAAAQADFEGRVLRELAQLRTSDAEVIGRLDRQDHAYGIDRRGVAALLGPRARRRALELVAFLAIAWQTYERARALDSAAHAAPPSAPAETHGKL